MDAALLKGYRYHRANGGTAEGSLRCARIRILLDAAIDAEVAEVTWEYEQERYEDVFGFESDAERDRFYRDIESNTITGPYWAALKVNGEHVASLGMITLGPRDIDGDYYAKLVEVELAMEAEDDLRQALGDALDAAECEAIEIDGPPNGEYIGRCDCGRALYRSHFAGTIYHSTDD